MKGKVRRKNTIKKKSRYKKKIIKRKERKVKLEYGNYRKDKYERGKTRKTKRRIEDKNEGLEIDTVNGGKKNVKKKNKKK